MSGPGDDVLRADLVKRLRERHYLGDDAKARLPEAAADLVFLLRREREEAADFIERAAVPPTIEARPKGLRWELATEGNRWRAWHPWGAYEIVMNKRDVEYWSPEFNAAGATWPSLAAAQKDIGETHERRVRSLILSALEPVSPSAPTATEADLVSTGAALLSLLDDYMTVSSMTSNERYAQALEDFRLALKRTAPSQEAMQ